MDFVKSYVGQDHRDFKQLKSVRRIMKNTEGSDQLIELWEALEKQAVLGYSSWLCADTASLHTHSDSALSLNLTAWSISLLNLVASFPAPSSSPYCEAAVGAVIAAEGPERVWGQRLESDRSEEPQHSSGNNWRWWNLRDTH